MRRLRRPRRREADFLVVGRDSRVEGGEAVLASISFPKQASAAVDFRVSPAAGFLGPPAPTGEELKRSR